MTAAEVQFLKAEAGLRGWAGAGDTQSNSFAKCRDDGKTASVEI